MSTTLTDTSNYRGELFLVGQTKTPFLNAIAGNAKRSNSFVYSMAQPWSLAAGAQPAVTENDSIGTLTPTTITRGEDTNTAQIFLNTVGVSFVKQAQYGLMSGINTDQGNPVVDELTFQKYGQLKQMAQNMEKSFLEGAYQAAANTSTAAKTRGVITGISTNSINASSAQLSRALMDQLLRTMYANGASFDNAAILVNAYQKQQLSKLYEYVPMSRNEAGSNIQLIETDVGVLRVMLVPSLTASTLAVVELSQCAPVFVPVRFSEATGQAEMSADGVDVLWQPTAITSASVGGFFISFAGISYGAEESHGKLYGLATS